MSTSIFELTDAVQRAQNAANRAEDAAKRAEAMIVDHASRSPQYNWFAYSPDTIREMITTNPDFAIAEFGKTQDALIRTFHWAQTLESKLRGMGVDVDAMRPQT